MNCSGAPVQSLLQYYKGSPAQVVVVHDDIDLALMEVKIRLSGGAGGHNGVRDLIAHLGPDFIRYRVGIGPRPEGPEASESLADYVLRPFSAEQKALKEEKMPKIIQGLQLLVDKGPDSAMNRVHSL